MRNYKAKTWKKGDTLTPTALNNMEKGIAQLTDEIIKMNDKLESLEKRIAGLEEKTNDNVKEETTKDKDDK